MIRIVMKCEKCPWELITEINLIEDWAKLDEANWKKSKHVSDFNHTVIIKQDVIYRMKKY